jgi:predicted alpha/beta hydrolase
VTLSREERGLRGGEPVTLAGQDGTRLRGELLFPSARSAQVIVALSHAMMVDRRTLDQPREEGLLSQLLDAGAAVLWFDQRGHGQSRPLPAQGASWDYDALVRDAGVIAAYLAERFPALPRVAIGHSLFGHVALAHQAKVGAGQGGTGYDGLVLLAANVWLKTLESQTWRWWCKRLTFSALVAGSRPLGYLPVRRLRMGTADEPYAYFAQMGTWLRFGDWRDGAGFSFLRGLDKVHVPVLSVASAGDHLLAEPSCQLRFACHVRGPVTHITVAKRFGYDCEPDHMGLVMDARLLPLWREIAEWACAIPRASLQRQGQSPLELNRHN